MSLRPALVLMLLAAVPGCASRRLLAVENELLRERSATLEQRLEEVERNLPDPADFAREVDLEVIHEWLDRAGYVHTWNRTGQGHIRMDHNGRNTRFAVTIQHFPNAGVVFMATDDYLQLDEAQSTESVILLLVQLAALNYDLLVGKFQMNPETGEVILSSELHVRDGVGYQTFVQALDHLTSTADARYPDLRRAIEGLGI